MGCGKGYLTFAAYDHLRRAGVPVTMQAREKEIEAHLGRARELLEGWPG